MGREKFNFNCRRKEVSITAKKAVSIITAMAVLCLQTIPAWSLPQINEIVNGDVTTNINGNNLEITATDKTIINYDSFNVGLDEQVLITLDSSNSEILNRVIGSSVSEIFGGVECNGRFILVNENGIRFNQGSWLNAKDFILSTRDITNQNFLEDSYIFEKSNQAILDQLFVNKGNLNVSDAGFGVIIAGAVDNQGVIAARLGTAALLGAEKVTLTLSNDSLISVAIDKEQTTEIEKVTDQIASSGDIAADGGLILINAQSLTDIFENSINLTGVTRAVEAESVNGEINLFASGAVESRGTLQSDILYERGASFKASGIWDIEHSYITNDDGAVRYDADITLSGADITDVEDIILGRADGVAVEITLGSDMTFIADCGVDGGACGTADGSGRFFMEENATVKGQSLYNLIIKSSEDAVLRGISNVKGLVLDESYAGSHPTYRVASDSDCRSKFILNNSDLSVDSGKTFVFSPTSATDTFTIGTGTKITGEGTFSTALVFFLDEGYLDASSVNFTNNGVIDIDTFSFGMASWWSSNPSGKILIFPTTYGTLSNPTNILIQTANMASGSATVDLDLTGTVNVAGDFKIASDANGFAGNPTTVNFNADNFTLNVGGDFIVGGSWNEAFTVVENVTFSDGDLNVEGDFLITQNANETVNFDASAVDLDIDIDGNFTVNSGTFTAPQVIDDTSFLVGGNWRVSGTGIFDANNGRVVMDATDSGNTIVTSSSGSDDFYDLKFNGNGGLWQLSDSVTVDNDLYLSAGTFNTANYSLAVSDDLTVGANSGTAVAGLTTGTSAVDITGDFIIQQGANETTNFTAGSGLITVNGFYLNQGSPNIDWLTNQSTFTINSINDYTGVNALPSNQYYHLSLYPNGGTTQFDLNSDTVVRGGLAVWTDATLDTTSNNYGITVHGNLFANGLLNMNESTITFTGSSDQAVQIGSNSLYNINIDKVSGVFSTNDDLDINNNLTITSGIVDQEDNNINLGGNLLIGANGSFVKGTGTLTFDGTGTSTWQDLTSGQDLGTVVINGTSKTLSTLSDVKASSITVGSDDGFDISDDIVTITGSGITFNGGLVSTNSSLVFSGADQSFSGSATVYNLLKTNSGSLTFDDGETLTVNGKLTLQGTTSDRLVLQSSLSGSSWKINMLGTYSLKYLDVSDSNNIGANKILVKDIVLTRTLRWEKTEDVICGLVDNNDKLSLGALNKALKDVEPEVVIDEFDLSRESNIFLDENFVNIDGFSFNQDLISNKYIH